ncbi:hypothetical protein OA959_02575 [SAR86 cluster bacterium]|nr:hypothetical protein [SAR86 cluster bacterium]|tara:strand:- start:156 stop:599 length:444 start_codon:yes stop_codon:yes gene_type:complete
MKKTLLIIFFISPYIFSDFEIWNSKGDESIKFYLDLKVITNESQKVEKLIEEMVFFIKKTEPGTKFYEYYISEDKKKISLTEYYKDSNAAEKHVADFLNGPYQETFFKLMEIQSFQVMGPASKNLIKSLNGITDDFRIEVDGFKRSF